MTLRELTSSRFYVSLLAALERGGAHQSALQAPFIETCDIEVDDFQETQPAPWIVVTNDGVMQKLP